MKPAGKEPQQEYIVTEDRMSFALEKRYRKEPRILDEDEVLALRQQQERKP